LQLERNLHAKETHFGVTKFVPLQKFYQKVFLYLKEIKGNKFNSVLFSNIVSKSITYQTCIEYLFCAWRLVDVILERKEKNIFLYPPRFSFWGSAN